MANHWIRLRGRNGEWEEVSKGIVLSLMDDDIRVGDDAIFEAEELFEAIEKLKRIWEAAK